MNRLIVILSLLVFCDSLLYGLITPLIPYYLNHLHMSTGQIGTAMAAYSASALLLGVPCGRLCDRWGYRRVLILGLGGLLPTIILFFFALSPWSLATARLVQGAAATATWTAALALAAVAVPPSQRGSTMGTIMTASGLGVILGPVWGGIVYHYGSYRAVFASVLPPLLLAFIWLILEPGLRRLEKNPLSPANQRSFLPLPVILANRQILIGLLVTIVGSACYGMLEPLIPSYLTRQFGLQEKEIGFIFGAMSLLYTLGAPLYGRVGEMLGEERVILAGNVAVIITLSGLICAPALLPCILFFCAYGPAAGFMHTPVLSYTARALEEDSSSSYGLAYGLLNTAYSIGFFAGPIIGGWLDVRFDFKIAVSFFILLLVALAISVKIIAFSWPKELDTHKNKE